MFETLTGRLNQVFDELRRRGKLSEADVDAAMREVRLALLEADVHFSVVKTFIARVRERAVGAEVSKALNPGQQVIKIVNEELIADAGRTCAVESDGSEAACHYDGRSAGLRQNDCRRQACATAALERGARDACRR